MSGEAILLVIYVMYALYLMYSANGRLLFLPLLLVWFVFLVTFCLVGMELFGGRMNFENGEDKPRFHFDKTYLLRIVRQLS